MMTLNLLPTRNSRSMNSPASFPTSRIGSGMTSSLTTKNVTGNPLSLHSAEWSVAISDSNGATDNTKYPAGDYRLTGAESLSRKPWNTAVPWNEDMPRKFLDIRFTDYPICTEKGQLHPFPAPGKGFGSRD